MFGYAKLELGEVCSSISSGKSKERSKTGTYPVYGSTGIIARTNRATYDKTNILIARVGANAGYVHLASGSYDVSDNTLIADIKPENNLKYIFYILQNIGLNRFAKGGGQPLITAGQIKQIEIKIPDRITQDKVIKILDEFEMICTDLNAGIPAEINARNKQYEYYRDKLLSFKAL